jgi:hypothetical protein
MYLNYPHMVLKNKINFKNAKQTPKLLKWVQHVNVMYKAMKKTPVQSN